MITRILKPNEIWGADLIQAICFEFPFNLEEAKQKVREDTLATLPNRTYFGSFTDDETTLMGSLIVNNYRANFEDKIVLMGGVGGVATLPQYRKKGVIHNCIKKALNHMYANNFLFSALYPFSRSFYHQFGYENGPYLQELTISLAGLKTNDVGGFIEQLLPGDDLTPLLEVYEEFYRKYNLAIERREYNQELSQNNLLDQKRYIYLWRDEKKTPRGFIIFQKTDDDVFDCTASFAKRNAFLALDLRAYQALFHFINQAFSNHYRTLKLMIPAFIHLDSLIKDSKNIGINLYYNGMLRVVNCQKVLELCKVKGKGSLKIAIVDSEIPENNGTWRIDFGDNTPNRVVKTLEKPDLSMPISALGPLICGIRTALDLKMMPEVTIYDETAPFGNLFYAKPCHITEYF